MKKEAFDPAANRETVDAMFAKAIAEGRHSDKVRSTCGGCGKQVEQIMHITLERKRLCFACALTAGAIAQCATCKIVIHPSQKFCLQHRPAKWQGSLLEVPA